MIALNKEPITCIHRVKFCGTNIFVYEEEEPINDALEVCAITTSSKRIT